MKCLLCGSNYARIRQCELSVAKITLRAHVDCDGHSQYRDIRLLDVLMEIARLEKEEKRRKGES